MTQILKLDIACCSNDIAGTTVEADERWTAEKDDGLTGKADEAMPELDIAR